MTGPTPATIGSYRVLKRIGQGGFATVFECVDDRLEDNVAIKLLADNHAFDAEVRSRFLSEGRVLRQIDNQSVIKVHDAGTIDTGQPYLVLELADRGDLRSRVVSLSQAGWKPSIDDVRQVLSTLSEAVGALHRRSLVHRDLTPGNLLIRSTDGPAPVESPNTAQRPILESDERMIVADLGLAKHIGAGGELSILAGTPGFSAPEQLQHGQVTKKVDVYASAKIVEWLLGYVDDAEPLKPSFLAGLQPALATDPNRRPDSVQSLEASVTDLLRSPASLPSGVQQPPQSPPSQPTPSVQSTPAAQTQVNQLGASTPPSSNRWVRFVLPFAVLLLVAIVGLFAFANLTGPSRPESIGDNLGQVTGSVDGRDIIVSGPERIPVGRTGRFVATAPEGSGFVWRTSSGEVMSQTDITELQGAEPGSLTVELEVTLPTGESTIIVYPFEVIDQDDEK